MGIDDDRAHVRCQPIPAPRHRLDVRAAVRLVSERLAQHVDVLCEVGLIDKGVRPEGFDQLGFRHHTVAVLGEQHQQVEGLGGKGNRVAAAHKMAEPEIDTERPELEEVLLGQ